MRRPKTVTPECFNRGSTMLTTTLSHVEATQQTKRASHDEFQTSLARVFGLEDCPTYLIGGWQREIVVRW
jgi:hypothetical protein